MLEGLKETLLQPGIVRSARPIAQNFNATYIPCSCAPYIFFAGQPLGNLMMYFDTWFKYNRILLKCVRTLAFTILV